MCTKENHHKHVGFEHFQKFDLLFFKYRRDQFIHCRVAFSSYFISVIEEPSLSVSDKAELSHEQNLLAEYTRREGSDFNELAPQKSRYT